MSNPPTKPIIEALRLTEGWNDLNATQKATHACREITLRGEPLPAASEIREIIGGGSNSDISKAKADFLADLAKMYSKSGGAIPSAPDSLKKVFHELWLEAVNQAALNHEEAMAKAEEDLRQAVYEKNHAVANLEHLKNQFESIQQAASAKDELIDDLRLRLEADTQEIDQKINQLKDENNTLKIERDTWKETASDQKAELAAAVERLDGVERHRLMSIEEARQASEKQIAAAKRKMQHEISQLTIEREKMRVRANESSALVANLETQNESLSTELRLKDGHIQDLKSENKALLDRLLEKANRKQSRAGRRSRGAR